MTDLIGPFIGNVTESTAVIWVYLKKDANPPQRKLKVTIHSQNILTILHDSREVELSPNSRSAIFQFTSLSPDTKYFYQIYEEQNPDPLRFAGLTPEDLQFRTLPTHGFSDQLDFLVMSCHDPKSMKDDGYDGYAVWARIPDILKENKNVRFGLLIGDQVYADSREVELLKEKDLKKRESIYYDIYEKYWSNPYYRRVLCQLPTFAMWDDHDITDGWGSREDSFENVGNEFKLEWKGLFESAKEVFQQMQAVRNPAPPSPDYKEGFDFYFRIGNAGFAIPDLRSNRNSHQKQIWSPKQFNCLKDWVDSNRQQMDTFFFVSTVVFSHGLPRWETFVANVLDSVLNWLGKKLPKYKGKFDSYKKGIDDFRDDINDSWGAKANAVQADGILDYLFSLQNPSESARRINVVILCGDIHTAGYSVIYSSDPNHKICSTMPHIVASPVANKPFSSLGESYYRKIGMVSLGKQGKYTAQVSPHFGYRNVVIVSLRNSKDQDSQLKVKYYLENFSEPKIMLFYLARDTHCERINWNIGSKNGKNNSLQKTSDAARKE